MAEAILQAKKPGEGLRRAEMIRAAATDPAAPEMMRKLYVKDEILFVVQAQNLDHAEVRAVMLTTLISSCIFTSRIVPLENLSPATESQRKNLFGKLGQQILTAKIYHEGGCTLIARPCEQCGVGAGPSVGKSSALSAELRGLGAKRKSTAG